MIRSLSKPLSKLHLIFPNPTKNQKFARIESKFCSYYILGVYSFSDEMEYREKCWYSCVPNSAVNNRFVSSSFWIPGGLRGIRSAFWFHKNKEVANIILGIRCREICKLFLIFLRSRNGKKGTKFDVHEKLLFTMQWCFFGKRWKRYTISGI